MKKIIICICFLSLSANVYAQAESGIDTKPKPTWQVGFNSTQLLKQFFSSNTSAGDPYTIVARYISGANATRFGAGISSNSRTETTDQFKDSKKIANQAISLRIGYEWRRDVHQKWTVYYGFDFVNFYRNNKSSTDSGFDNVTILNRQIEAGVATLLGLEFKLNERISLSTEGNFSMLYTGTKEGTTFSGATQLNSLKTSNGFNTNTQLPVSLFLNVKF